MMILKVAAWVVLCFVWFIYVPGSTVLEMERRLATLEAARTPKLKLEFDRDDPACKMRIGHPEPYQTLFRVRVTNHTDSTTTGVQVKLTDLEPLAVHYLPAPLRFMHEGPTTREITLGPRQSAYVDVIQQADVGGPIYLWHSVDGQEHQLTPLGDFSLIITASARNTVPVSEKFCVLLDSVARARFETFRDQELRAWTV